MLGSSVRRISGKYAFLLVIACGLAADAQQPSSSLHRSVVTQYCITCHNSKLKVGGLALDGISAESVSQHPQEWEKVVRKLRGHYMPPPGVPRPDDQTYSAVVSSLVKELDSAAAATPTRTSLIATTTTG